MKTPEKIYLYPYSTDGIYEVETKPLEGTVEYTRTDAFVKKMKEVDLEKEFENYMDKYNGVWVDSDYIRFAKHFFELGLNASNPLTWEDIKIIGKLRLKVALDLRNKELESSTNNPIKFTEDDLCKEVFKRFKAQKGE